MSQPKLEKVRTAVAPGGYRIDAHGALYKWRERFQAETGEGFASVLESELWALVQAQEERIAADKESIADWGKRNAEVWKSRIEGLLSAAKEADDLLFGLLDYFEPGPELTTINKQREKNLAAIATAEGAPTGGKG